MRYNFLEVLIARIYFQRQSETRHYAGSRLSISKIIQLLMLYNNFSGDNLFARG